MQVASSGSVFRAVVVVALVGMGPGVAWAQADAADGRLAFVEERVEVQRTHAEIWWGSWLMFYTSGAIVQSVRAANADTAVDRADLWVSAVKAGGGVVRLLVQPYGGIEGLDEAPAEPGARLAHAEAVLAHNADRTTPFGPWYAHLLNLGVNGAGAVIVGAGYDGWRDGLISAGIGFAVGEAMILTGPWEADDDLEAYRDLFQPELSLVPGLDGAALRVRF